MWGSLYFAKLGQFIYQPTTVPTTRTMTPVTLDTANVFACACCNSHLARQDDVVSKAFQGRHGRAYLLKKVVNVNLGVTQERLLITGLHEVADLTCRTCGSTVGWKYLRAHEESQKYKEDKFILEKGKLAKENGWV